MKTKFYCFCIWVLILLGWLNVSQVKAQNNSPLFPKSIDWKSVAPMIKKQFVLEANVKRFDSVYKVNNLTFYSFKGLEEGKVKLQLLQYEQDFTDVDTLFTSNYIILVSIYHGETGHGVKLTETDNFLLVVSINERFNSNDLNHYLATYKQSIGHFFYNDQNPWQKFKSFKRTIKLEKLMPVPDLIKPLY